jgi:hypothetical protein
MTWRGVTPLGIMVAVVTAERYHGQGLGLRALCLDDGAAMAL